MAAWNTWSGMEGSDITCKKKDRSTCEMKEVKEHSFCSVEASAFLNKCLSVEQRLRYLHKPTMRECPTTVVSAEYSVPSTKRPMPGAAIHPHPTDV